jgi:Trk K+ transport system NAD-binding subunit
MYYYVLVVKNNDIPDLMVTNQAEEANKYFEKGSKNVLLSYDQLINPDTEKGKMEALAQGFAMVMKFSALSNVRKAHIKEINSNNVPILEKPLPAPSTSVYNGFTVNNN